MTEAMLLMVGALAGLLIREAIQKHRDRVAIEDTLAADEQRRPTYRPQVPIRKGTTPPSGNRPPPPPPPPPLIETRMMS